MSMAEPLQPDPTPARTALDPEQDAPIKEPHADAAKAEESPLKYHGTPADQVNDALPLLDVHPDVPVSADFLNGEAPD